MRVLITGAAGFVGSHLVDASLARGDRVRVVVRPRSDPGYLGTLGPAIDYFRGDLCDPVAVHAATQDIDVVYHAAGRVTDHGSYTRFYRDNYVATDRLLTAAQTQGAKRFVFVSSPSIFANHEDQVDIDESIPWPRTFVNYYARTKALAEQRVLAANSSDMVTCAVRPRGVWGPRDHSGFVPKLLRSLARGRLKHLAPGKQVMASICHVDNAVAACLAAASAPDVGGRSYFVADARPVEVWSFISDLARTFSLSPVRGTLSPWLRDMLVGLFELVWKVPYLRHRVSPPVSRYGVGMLTLHSTYKLDRARSELGYVPRVELAQGLHALKAWVDELGGVERFIGLVPR